MLNKKALELSDVEQLINTAFEQLKRQLPNPGHNQTYKYKHALIPKYRKKGEALSISINEKEYPLIDHAVYITPQPSWDLTAFFNFAHAILNIDVKNAKDMVSGDGIYYYRGDGNTVLIENTSRSRNAYPHFATEFSRSNYPNGTILLYGKKVYEHLNRCKDNTSHATGHAPITQHAAKQPPRTRTRFKYVPPRGDSSIPPKLALKYGRIKAPPKHNNNPAPIKASPPPPNLEHLQQRVSELESLHFEAERQAQLAEEKFVESTKRTRSFILCHEEALLISLASTEKKRTMDHEPREEFLATPSVIQVQWDDVDQNDLSPSSSPGLK